MNISNITGEIIERFSNEFKKKENQKKIKTEMIDPIIIYTFNSLYPYIVCASVIFILTFIMVIIIFVLIIHTMCINSQPSVE